MAVTVSLVLLFGATLAFLLKTKSLSYGSALVAVLFGFYLASSGASQPINDLTAAFVDALSDI